MCEDEIRKLLGNEYVDKENKFYEEVDKIQAKYVNYFEEREPNELSHYVTTFARDGEISMKIDPELRTDIAKLVVELFNKIWKTD